MHNGIDIGFAWGAQVPAICAGWITSSTDSSGQNPMSAGPKSVIQHCGDWLVLYGHMSATYTGFKNAGEIVGLSGGPWGAGGGNYHLHLEIRTKQASTTYSNRAVNPAPLFDDANGLVDPGKMKCGDAFSQPDVPYGSATKCSQGTGPWCGCAGYCN
jgi:murein DD-endopeptidase MepM/ murein hydrolase activator NlpD